MKNIFRLFFIGVIVFHFTGCKKEKLPKTTQSGKNTFGCKIEGKVFLPEKVFSVPSSPGLSAFYYYDINHIRTFRLEAIEPAAESQNRLKRELSIEIKNPRLGNNFFDDTNEAELYIYTYDGSSTITDHYISIKNEGSVNITRLDSVAQIISGTFSFKATRLPLGEKSINVTDGRFDVKY